MSLPTFVLDVAEDELKAAERWYETQRPGLGGEFREEVDRAIRFASSAPEAASPATAVPSSVGARQGFVRRFPYSVVFIVVGGSLWILAFAHHRRRPGYWKERL